jgi:hypothetical protein
MPDQAVLADSWTLFCPECAQKMRIIMAAPAQDGKETRTFECVYGHREWMTVALHWTQTERAHMPRYFFNVEDDRTIIDQEGTAFLI